MINTVKILHFENDDINAQLIKSKIQLENMSCEIKNVYKMEDYLRALMTDLFDLVLCDCSSPDIDWINANSFVREISPHTSFILVSSTQNEIIITDEITKHLSDYFQNAKLDNISPVINSAISRIEIHDGVSCNWD